MTRKEAIDLVLSKVDADRKDAFIAELREAKTKEERSGINKKYNIVLSDEESKAFREAMSNRLSDEDLDAASGGGCDNNDPNNPFRDYPCECC